MFSLNFFNIFINNNLYLFFGLLFLFSTVLSFFFYFYLGLYGVFIFNILTLFLFWLSVTLCFDFFMSTNSSLKLNFGNWFYLNQESPVSFDFLIDSLSFSYVQLILTISIFVQLYTFSYFRYEPSVPKLILFLNLFIISMVFLVISGNTLMLFLGWELIGLTSFVLINFWTTRKATLKSAFKAFSFNKFSDISFLFFVVLTYMLYETTSIDCINTQSFFLKNVSFNFLNYDVSVLDFACLFLIFSAFIKSAQIGGHVWLPDSMEAPVPASALIHSATLVSAGLFLFLRFSNLFELSTVTFYIVPIFGSLTAFYGGVGAMFQSDGKKILAYSTISHCGFLMVSFTSFQPEFTLFYLYVHGFFKAGIFLCVGNIIRFSKNYQDFRKAGLLYKFLPFECFLIGSGLLNLGGLPLSLGFFMKHFFLVSINTYYFTFLFTFVFSVLGAITGVFYSFRLYYYVFFDFKKASKYVYLTSSNQTLSSVNYSNTTIASNIAITGIFILAYSLSFYFYCFITNSSFLPVDTVMTSNIQYTKNILSDVSFLWNLAFFNLIVIVCFIGACWSQWRKIVTYSQILNTFWFNIVINLLILVFILLLI